MLHYLDWRDAPAGLVAPLYDAECDRWQRRLGWNYRPSCAVFEAARRDRRLPGLIACTEDGAPVGWSYFMLHAGRLQIGALLGRDRFVLQGILGAVLRSPDARSASGVSCFFYPELPGAAGLLTRRHFAVFPHAYLRARLDAGPPAGLPAASARCAAYRVREWGEATLPDIARTFAVAYEGMREARCYTVTNRPDEWLLYLGNIDGGTICGRVNPSLSLFAQAPDGSTVAALVATDLAPGTAHVAQLAVAPAHRGTGLGARLVQLACSRAREAGFTRVTLLVAESNLVARRLYDRLGFESVDEFVFAYRDRTDEHQV
jgi:ribosomal protein S18 acetylase RimI-like enzyme